MNSVFKRKTWLCCQLCLILALLACRPLKSTKALPRLPKPLTLLPTGSRILWIGDSLTLQPGFRQQVEEVFSTQYSQLRLRFERLAAAGATVGWALKMFQQYSPKPDVVLIMLGTNDSGSLGVQRSILRSYRANMTRLIDCIMERGARPILITPPCVAPDSYALQQKNRMLNRIAIELIQLGQLKSIPVIDLHAMFCQLLKDLDKHTFLFADDKHPNSEGHRQIATMLLRILVGAPLSP